MKQLIVILLLTTCFAMCKNKTKEAEQLPPVASSYDLNKDSSVYSGEMKRYWLVLLKKGPNRTQDSLAAEKIQAAHMTNINRLANEGKLVMAGPLGIDADLRGIFLMDCKDSLEVERLINADSAIISGRLKAEFYPWWTEKGKYLFK